MDGYAVRGADVRGRVRAVAGGAGGGRHGADGRRVPARRSAPGEAVAIATGGFLPEGADAVVMVEHTTRAGRRRRASRCRARWSPGANVVRARRGSRARRRGAARGPPPAAAGSRDAGDVRRDDRRRPPPAARRGAVDRQRAVSIPAETPRPGQVRDANQTALGAQVTAAGCDVTLRRHRRATTPRRCGARSRGCSPTTTRSSCRAARRSGRRTCRPTRSPTSSRPASCSTASTSVPASRRCSRARAASRSWACPGFRRRR